MPFSPLDRRAFLRLAAAGAAGLIAPGCPAPSGPAPVPLSAIGGKLWGQDHELGHLIRTGELAQRKVDATEEVEVLILGAGVAGLSAAWRLRREGHVPRVLDAGRAPGGNSRWGELPGVTRYPWGAHYLRVPTREHPALETFMEEVGLLRGRDSKGRLEWDLRAVCGAPQERIYEDGIWAEGLFPPPRSGTKADREQYERFRGEVELLSKLVGSDGRKAFTIPIAESSRDPQLLALDQVTFAAWLSEHGYDSPALRWLLQYSVEDDYGCSLETTSAWAGLHYFCARRSEDPSRDHILAWPEGNGRLVQHLLSASGEQPVAGRALCYRIAPGSAPGEGSEAWVYHADEQRCVRYRAEQLIWAGPRFILDRLLGAQPSGFSYSPWLVANVALRQQPGGVGAELAWDNVAYGADSLGYVVANRERAPEHPLVVTWYEAFSGPDPRAERERLYALDHAAITERVVRELGELHPNLRGEVLSVDAWRWGHAMIRPVPGFLWGTRLAALEREDALLCAHSDLSGVSIFEEAFYRGVVAGESVLRRRGAGFTTLLRR